MGPLEFVALEFTGNRFRGEILPALQAVVDKEIIRVIDLTFVKKDADGTVTAMELHALPPDDAVAASALAADIADLISAADIAHVGEALAPESAAALLIFEHTWVSDVREAVLRANGRVLMHETIPADVAEAAAGAAAASAAADGSRVEV